MRKMAIIHTSLISIQDLSALCRELMPEIEIMNIIDDSLLKEVITVGGITSGVVRRICAYALEAEQTGADLILNQCSSVGLAVDAARKLLRIPYLKIDEPMAEKAAAIGGRIAVIATVATTLGPSCGLLEAAAAQIGKRIAIKPCLVKGAFEALQREGKDKHNQMLIETICQEAETSDVIVLAQGSMIAVLPMLPQIQIPVLTSPRLGIERAAAFFRS
jgi:Asp/Glu/hydantoin racemase